jgi:ADP-ribose pyrophosphatase YjhB (NUDIX family)
MAKKNRIRILALGLFRHQDRILVFKGHDSKKGEDFYRPLGGGIKFGETSKGALRREIKEELKAKIKKPILLGVLENIFYYEGVAGHEVVYIYDAKFKDKSLYQKEKLNASEGENDKFHFDAEWIEISELKKKQIPLYPDGLLEIITKQS